MMMMNERDRIEGDEGAEGESREACRVDRGTQNGLKIERKRERWKRRPTMCRRAGERS